MRQRRGILPFNADLDRFCLDEGEEMTSLHCGDVLGIRIDADYTWCRLEYEHRQKRWNIIFQSPPGGRESHFILYRDYWYDACVNW